MAGGPGDRGGGGALGAGAGGAGGAGRAWGAGCGGCSGCTPVGDAWGGWGGGGTCGTRRITRLRQWGVGGGGVGTQKIQEHTHLRVAGAHAYTCSTCSVCWRSTEPAMSMNYMRLVLFCVPATAGPATTAGAECAAGTTPSLSGRGDAAPCVTIDSGRCSGALTGCCGQRNPATISAGPWLGTVASGS